MYKIIIKGKNINRTYDKIFKIIDKHSTFFRVDAENEYQTEEGYVLEFKNIPPEAILEISELKEVEEI